MRSFIHYSLLIFILVGCSKSSTVGPAGGSSDITFTTSKDSYFASELMMVTIRELQESSDSLSGFLGTTGMTFKKRNDSVYTSLIPASTNAGQHVFRLNVSSSTKQLTIEKVDEGALTDQLFLGIVDKLQLNLDALLDFNKIDVSRHGILASALVSLRSNFNQLSAEEKTSTLSFLYINTSLFLNHDLASDHLWNEVVDLSQGTGCLSSISESNLQCLLNALTINGSHLPSTFDIMVEIEALYGQTFIEDLLESFLEINISRHWGSWDNIHQAFLIPRSLELSDNFRLDSVHMGEIIEFPVSLTYRTISQEDLVSSNSMVLELMNHRDQSNAFFDRSGRDISGYDFPELVDLPGFTAAIIESSDDLVIEVENDPDINGIVELNSGNVEISFTSQDESEREFSFWASLNSADWSIQTYTITSLFNPGGGPCFFSYQVGSGEFEPDQSNTNSCGYSGTYVFKTVVEDLVVDLKYEKSGSAVLGYLLEGHISFSSLGFHDFGGLPWPVYEITNQSIDFGFEEFNFKQGKFPDRNNPDWQIIYDESCGLILRLHVKNVIPTGIKANFVIPNTAGIFQDCQ